MESAGVYGNAGNIYGSQVMVHAMGSMFSKARKSCESFWDMFWDDLFDDA